MNSVVIRPLDFVGERMFCPFSTGPVFQLEIYVLGQGPNCPARGSPRKAICLIHEKNALQYAILLKRKRLPICAGSVVKRRRFAAYRAIARHRVDEN